MGLSKRERMIVLVTAVVVGLFVGDRLIRAPIANHLSILKNQKHKSQGEVQKAKLLFTQSAQAKEKHPSLFDKGFRSDAEAESEVAKALDQWSGDAGLTFTSIKPERSAGDKGFKEIVFVIAGKGTLEGVALFLYRVESSELPVKVKYMQLGSTSEAGDYMSLELRLSTLYLASDDKSSAPQRQSKRQEARNEEI